MLTLTPCIDSSDLKPKIETESAKLPSGSLAALALAYDDSEDEVTELQQGNYHINNYFHHSIKRIIPLR